MTDQPTLIYLEADDEITAVVRRVRAAEPGRVVIVAPGRSRATSSAVALRLLARAAADDEREIAVVGDELTRSLAAEAGLTAYRSVDDARLATAPASDGPAPAQHATIHVVRGPAADDTAPTLAAIAAADTETRPVRLAPPRRDQPAPQPGPSRRPRPARRARRPVRRAANPLVAVLGIAGAFVVIAAVLGAMFLPAATVAIRRSRSIVTRGARRSSEICSPGESAIVLNECREPSTRSLVQRATSSWTCSTVVGWCSRGAL